MQAQSASLLYTKPAIGISVALIWGILLAESRPSTALLYSLFGISLATLLLVVVYFLARKKRRIPPFWGYGGAMLWGFALGYTSNYTEIERTTLCYDAPNHAEVMAILSDTSVRTEKALRLPVRVLAGLHGEKGVKMMLYHYLPEGESIALPRMGDTVVCKLHKIVARERMSRPGYRHWLQSKNIAAIATILPTTTAFDEEKLPFLNASNTHGFVLLPRKKAQRVNEFALDLRDKLLAHIEALPLSRTDKALWAAITLGYRSDEAAQQMGNAFRDVGAAHILAVSGFHLAVVVGILWCALAFLNAFPRLRLLKPLLIIMAAWAFALLTGLSAPTTRAALMLTLYQIGYFTGAPPQNSLNLLAFTAVILLLLHPGNLFALGFQLSFVAVLSILLFYPFFTSSAHLKRSNPLLRYVYQLLALCISAQLLTLPLILYHFGETPLVFIWSNLPLVVLATLLIPVGLFYLLTAPLLEKMPIINDGVLEIIRMLSAMVQKTLHFFGSTAPDKVAYSPSGLQLFALYSIAAALYIVLWRTHRTSFFFSLPRSTPRVTRQARRKGKRMDAAKVKALH